MPWNKRLLLLAGLALFLLLHRPYVLTPASHAAAYPAGEKLSYRITWSNLIEAGTAELTVGQPDTDAGTVRLQLKAQNTPAISKLYTFSDDFVSTVDLGYGAPRQYEKRFVDKTRNIHETTLLDQFGRSARFTDSKGERRSFPIELGTQDPISLLYGIRNLGLQPGLRAIFPVIDGGKIYSVEIRVTGTELISTQLGSFQTHRVEATIRDAGGNPQPDKQITVWFSDDDRRVPVLASVFLRVGAALVELVGRN
ncbi:MAG: DUF3108 domain-containing protein [Acidobacteriota bacterium]